MPPTLTLDTPSPITVKDPVTGEEYKDVQNYDEKGGGYMTLRRATELSVNSYYVQLTVRVGAKRIAETATRMGITSEIKPILSIALGTQGLTAALMTLALLTTALANGGSLMGAERSVPIVGDLLLITGWLATPLAFALIGLAVLYFPTRAQILDRHPWIFAALGAASAPILIISVLSAAFLLGADVVLVEIGGVVVLEHRRVPIQR